MPDILQALNRIRPGRRFTPPATANNPSQPGDVIKITGFTSSVSAEQIFRFTSGNAGSGLPGTFVAMKATGRVHIAFGPVGGVTDPTDADFLLEPGDSWQDFMLLNGDTSFKIKGDTTGGTGDFFLAITGR